jgi:GR25 family glycosyltransferase involved in LPS biosynthesis
MKIKDFFNKGYYINLDRRPDRKALFEEQMNQYDFLDFLERRSAEDALLQPDVEYVQHFCSFSFYKTFQDAYEKGYERIVVFEDDFLFLDEENRGIDNIENGLDQLSNFPDWDIIYFGGYIFDKEVHQVSPNLLKADTILTLHGYGVSRQGLEKLLPFRPFTDSAFDGWIGQRHYINKYVVYPMSSYQRTISSDLDNSGGTPPLSHFKQHYIQGKLIKLHEKESNNVI